MKIKHISLLPIVAGMLVCLAPACKTTEKNYRTAYERTIANDSDVTPFDQTIYNRFRREARDVKAIADGDTVDTRIIRTTVTPQGGGLAEWHKRYSVVVAEFKQRFNAVSLRDRYVDAGYLRTFIVQNGEPYYYILAGSSDNLHEMAILADSIKANPVIPLKTGFPYILQKP